jgi:hypothetical protein
MIKERLVRIFAGLFRERHTDGSACRWRICPVAAARGRLVLGHLLNSISTKALPVIVPRILWNRVLHDRLAA